MSSSRVYFLQSEKRSSNFMYLMVEFPRVKTNEKEYSIVYYEKVFSRLNACNKEYIQVSHPWITL